MADAVCGHIIQGMSVRKIGLLDDMPCEDTIYTWLSKYSEFSEKYRASTEHRTNKLWSSALGRATALIVVVERRFGRVKGQARRTTFYRASYTTQGNRQVCGLQRRILPE